MLRGNSLRLLGVDEIDIEVPLGGNLIYMRNRDVPGVVGKIGTLLGRHNVNIGNFALGRKEMKDGAEAIAVVQVDSPAPEAVLQEIAQLPEMHEVRGMRLEESSNSNWQLAEPNQLQKLTADQRG